MREIKFRGLYKRIMVYGNFIKGIYDDKVFYQIENTIDTEFETYPIENPETIGQFTGLKDANGVKIYEGDIVIHDGIIKVIRYYEGSFIAKPVSRGGISYDALIHFAPCRTFKIIGNIHQNPELLGNNL